nr:RNA-directed DNA polymerase, eukaryota, reverse transcriptase zinc-binding domain protein [Tanacetum cinerariifolium]
MSDSKSNTIGLNPLERQYLQARMPLTPAPTMATCFLSIFFGDAMNLDTIHFTMREGGSLWVKVIKSIHGVCGGLDNGRTLGGGSDGSEVWKYIVKIGEEIYGVGLEFSSSCIGVLGDRKDIRFWVDRWVDNGRLCDRFPRDKWRWQLGEGGEFTVKELTRLIDEKILHVESGGHETLWNNLVPKKVNIFVWMALKGRLPVRVELDRRCIDLDSVLCPCCDNIVETCTHSLVTCDLAMSVWVKIFNWWKVGMVNVFTIDELFSSSGGVNVPTSLSRVWQSVLWTSGYFIWKERNNRVFDKKVSSINKIVQDIQLKSFEWIMRRSKKYRSLEWQQWLWEPSKIQLQ